MQNTTNVHTLICHNDISMAITCLSSLINNSFDKLNLIFHDDGSLTQLDTEILMKEFPESEVISKNEADEYIYECIKNYPNCLNFRKNNILSLKLFDVPIYSKSLVSYCDTDIFFFRPFKNLFKFKDSHTSAIFMSDRKESYSLKPLQIYKNQQFNLISKLNSGLYLYDVKNYDLELLDWFLSKLDINYLPIWVEQTCWALLASRTNTRMWDFNAILILKSQMDISYDLIAGHFTKPVRSLLSKYLSYYQNNYDHSTEKPIDVISIECNYCNAFKFLFSRIKNSHIGVNNSI